MEAACVYCARSAVTSRASRTTVLVPAPRRQEASKFGQAFWEPLKHVSATLWLEITGLFFALFAVFFGQNAWRTRTSALDGPEHAHFLLYAIVTLVFVYFCVSSFVKAARRGRRSAQ